MKHIKGLDTLRAIAVILVIHSHWGPGKINAVPFSELFLNKILASGGFAVDMFFVLSGFLITSILIKAKEETLYVSKFTVLKNFIIRRSLRIFPVYFILLLVVYILNYDGVQQNILYYVTYTSNFLFFDQKSWYGLGHTWSLSVEEQFYVIWPFIIVFTPQKFLLKVLMGFILCTTVAGIVTKYMYGDFSQVLPFNCFNAFAIGGLYSYARAYENAAQIIRKVLLYLLPVAIVFYILSYFELGFIPARLPDAIIAINLIIYVTEMNHGQTAERLLNNRLLTSLGKISYGVYLYHLVIPTYYRRVLKFTEVRVHLPVNLHIILNQRLVMEVLEFVFLIMISYLSYTLIEVKILKLKKYFNYTGSNETKGLIVPEELLHKVY